MPDMLSVIAARHCQRAFLAREVPRALLEKVLSTAANAPSSRNTQPWNVAVLGGGARQELSRKLCDAFDRGVKPAADYQNSPATLPPLFARRAGELAAATFEIKGIDRDDETARRAHVRENFRFFGAPIEMIFHLTGDAVSGGFLATGCFLQNVMLGLVANGLGSCPQYSVAGYADIVRQHLGLPADQIVVCGLAVGYPDPDAPVNRLRPPRAPLDDFVDWLS